MRFVFFYKAARHIILNRYKYMALGFFYLTGCMCGYYSAGGLSDALSRTLRANLEVRFYYRSPDLTAVFLSVLFAGLLWLSGFSPAGMVFVPLILLLSAALQSFFMQIAFSDIGLYEGFLALWSIVLFLILSAAGLFMGGISLGNALRMFSGRKRNLSFAEKAAVNNKKALAFIIAGFLYVVFSYITFLVNKAIF